MTSQSVITNKEQFLDEVINKILPSTDQVSFLVGFFYFSGFQQIYKGLEDKKIRILIGMDVEQTIRDLKFKFSDMGWISIKDTLNKFKDLVNKTDIFESTESLEALEIFIEKIRNWSLEIKQTLNPNHAKIYLFNHSDQFNQGWTLPWTMITGSWNLTYSGLHGQWEFNMIVRDPDAFRWTTEYFNNIRENEAVPLTTGWENDQIIKMLKNETWLKTSEPYLCYMRLLSEYFKENKDIEYPSDITDNNFQDLEYQTDAIKRWLHILEEHSGVIIADVVGLGKSIIGSALLYNLNEKAIIIAPPHLTDQWDEYREKFDFEAEVFSSGSVDKALQYDLESIHKAWVILIDEAHKYRNADTIDYGYLHQLCQWKKVILLTATPFNNKPEDIFNLIKLFQIPNKPTIHTSKWLLVDFSNLQKQYDELKKEAKKIDEKDDFVNDGKLRSIAQQIRQLIWSVVVRRSRVDLEKIEPYKKDLELQGYDFSKVKDPIELKFELWSLEELYVHTLERLTEVDDDDKPVYFKWARYNVLWYLIDTDKYKDKIEKMLGYDYMLLEWRQKNMPFFIRRLLVSRFESSIFSFKETLKSLIWSIDNMVKYMQETNWLPIIKKWSLPEIDDIADEDENNEIDDYKNIKIQELLQNKDGFLIPMEDIQDGFLHDIESDKQFLESLLYEWEQVDQDPKINTFIKKLEKLMKENKDRKVVVFSQYTSTIDYLESKLKDTFRTLKVTWKTKTEQLKKDIKFNFDAGVKKEEQKNDYDVLLGTDAISEWYNLHRAWIIINYDIPYNPTRVIQRIWRINRINKKVYDELFIYNYFPSLIGETHIWTKHISTLKIRMIATILWIDVKTLTKDEEVSSFYKKEMESDSGDENQESWDSKYLNDFKKAKIQDPQLLDKINAIPERTKLQRTVKKDKKWVLLFAKKGNNLLFQFYDNKTQEPDLISLEDAFDMFKAEIDEKATDVSKNFYTAYSKLKEDITKWLKIQALNRKEKEALDKAKLIFQETKDPYFQTLIKVIELRSLPLYYMKTLRKVTQDGFKEQILELKRKLSEQYLRKIIDIANSYDEEGQELIITQEFIQ